MKKISNKYKLIGYILLSFIALMVFGTLQSFGVDAQGVSMAGAAGVWLAQSDRQAFLKANNKYSPDGGVTPSYLRIEKTLNNSSSDYKFDFEKNGNELSTERKLERNDVFVATQIGFYLTRQETAKIGKERLMSYPNLQILGTATGFTAAHLETIYAGYLWLKINKTVVIENQTMYDFRKVWTSQQQASNVLQDEFTRAASAHTLPVRIDLSGRETNEMKVFIPTFSGLAIASVSTGFTNKLVCIMYGFLARNASQSKTGF